MHHGFPAAARPGTVHANDLPECLARRSARHGSHRCHQADLPGLRRHHPGGRPCGAGHAALPVRTVRQPRVAQPCLRLGRRRGGGDRPRAHRRTDRRRPARDRLHFRRDRIEQPGDQGRGAVPRRARQAPRHRQDRAQGGAGHDARAGAQRLRGDLPRRAGRRPARPGRAAGRAAPRHHAGVGDGW